MPQTIEEMKADLLEQLAARSTTAEEMVLIEKKLKALEAREQ